MLLGTNPPGDQVVLHSMRQCKIVVSAVCDISVLHQGVVQVAIEGFFYFVYVVQFRNSSYTDLFPLLDVRLWRRHTLAGCSLFTRKPNNEQLLIYTNFTDRTER